MSDVHSLVGVDTMVLIWGIRDAAGCAGDERAKRAVMLIDSLQESRTQIVFAMAGLPELLATLPETEHNSFLSTLEETVVFHPFDIPSSLFAAKLTYQRRINGGTVDETGRHRIYNDMLIVASTKASGATLFYSHDERSRRFATQLGLKARDLPPKHSNIFVDADIRAGIDPPMARSDRLQKRSRKRKSD